MLRRVTNNWSRRQKVIENLARTLPTEAHVEFKDVTPIRTGNAKRNTNFKSTASGGTITANYNYANQLNKGKSRQAPQGMTDPTIDFIRDKVKRTLK